MPLFLVQGRIDRTMYEGDTESSNETRIVEAKDEFEASSKFEFHFESRSSDYAVSYSAWDVIAHEVIT